MILEIDMLFSSENFIKHFLQNRENRRKRKIVPTIQTKKVTKNEVLSAIKEEVK